MNSNNMRYCNIDFLRFILAIIIVYGHLTGFLGSFYDSEIINKLVKNAMLSGSNSVSAFFIMSGFFLAGVYFKNHYNSVLDFIINRFIRLWPVIAFSGLILLIFGCFDRNDLLNLFFVSNGLALVKEASHNAAIWFVCVLFFLSAFFYYILTTFSQRNSLFIISIITFFNSVLLVQQENSIYCHIITPFYLTVGMVKGLACMGLGILIGFLYKKYSVKLQKINVLTCFSLSVIEGILLFNYIYYSVFHSSKYTNSIYYILNFSLLFILFLLSKGIISQFFNKKIFGFLGKYSYSIFVMHYVIITIFQKYLWKYMTVKEAFIITASVCLVAGILVNIYIEKPLNALIKDKIAKLTLGGGI